jgi:carotenoid cleavage dioxygenase-like enzyme
VVYVIELALKQKKKKALLHHKSFANISQANVAKPSHYTFQYFSKKKQMTQQKQDSQAFLVKNDWLEGKYVITRYQLSYLSRS